jgi:rare lipoprotein A
VVRVNDRGPFLHNRVIDLSFAAAHRIGIAQKGSGEVDVEAILPVEAPIVAAAPLPSVAVAPPSPAPAGSPRGEMASPVPVAAVGGGFVVQLGSFASNANAQTFVAHLENQLSPIGVEPKVRQVGALFRVFVGPYALREEARQTADRLRDALGLDSMIAVH